MLHVNVVIYVLCYVLVKIVIFSDLLLILSYAYVIKHYTCHN